MKGARRQLLTAARLGGGLLLAFSAAVSCGDGGSRALSVPSTAAGGDRSTAVYEIRMQAAGADVLVVRAADAGDFESIDVRVPAAAGVPEQHSTSIWYDGRLYESTTGPDGGPDYDVFDPANPSDIVGATILGEFTARSFIDSVEKAYEARPDRSTDAFDFVANNSAARRAVFGGGDRLADAIDFRGTLRYDASGRPITLDLRASKYAGLSLRATISYPAQPTVTTIIPTPETTRGPCVTLDSRGSYACGPGIGAGAVTVAPAPTATR